MLITLRSPTFKNLDSVISIAFVAFYLGDSFLCSGVTMLILIYFSIDLLVSFGVTISFN